MIALALRLLNRIAVQAPTLAGKRLDESARRSPMAYTWPGNVRELLHTLTYAALLSPGDEIPGATIETCLPRL